MDAAKTIPQIGVGGFTDPRTGDVSIWIEAKPPGGLRKTLETWIPGSVAHELHHSSRIRTGPGYGNTLAQALVSEGLADHFAEEAFPKTPSQPWDHALTKAQERSLWLAGRRELNVPFGYDHPSWFFGGGDMPQWAGYTLGFIIVGRYLDHRRTASETVAVDSTRVIERLPWVLIVAEYDAPSGRRATWHLDAAPPVKAPSTARERVAIPFVS